MSGKTIATLPQEKCTGCMMCGDICPKSAISFMMGDDSFWYPVINKNICVNCGICEKKCPTIGKADNKEMSITCYGAKTKCEEIRENSTSGGVFSELAMAWMQEGGLCCGAIYNQNNIVVHCVEKTMEGIKKLRQSKYVQSDTKNVYKEVGEKLRLGYRIMFCGTPCQVAALISYLEGKTDNLLTFDFVCCGICSPLVYKKYIDMLEKRYHSKVKKVWFKNKQRGWRGIGTDVEFENGKHYFRTGNRDLFMTAFVTDGLSIRNSCYNCTYRKIPHDSDITVADFWGIETVRPDLDDNQGISAVILNTEKGKYWFGKVKDKLEFFETNINQISQGNFTVFKPKEPSVNREKFLKEINLESFESVMKKYGSYTGVNKIQKDWNYFKSELRNLIKKRRQ